MNTIKTVHVIFKTHLDVGFTDLAENVINQYMEQYIPKALQLAEDLQRNDGSAQFVWTTGSWLINEYLKKASKEQIRKMENAITAGRIAWHGLPFTTHTELVDPRLFEYGLSIAQKLNARFGKSTITAKMTDVPGHTIGMVPLLAKYGIRYLHLGVNPASKVPSVPEIFVWRAQDGSEVIVNYASNYGNIVQIEGCEDAMVFAHTGDNCGPPSIEDIQLEFAKLSEKFPGAVIQASTMEAFVSKMLDFKDHFPVVCEEIGDTWIHGAASDPTKIQQYRDLLRLRDKWLTKGRLDPASEEYSNFSDKLLLIPEHTWGMDEKKFLADFKHYSISEFKAARQADVVSKDAIPDKYAYIGSFAMDEGDGLSSELFASEGRKRSFHLFESSFQEKREYLQQAIQCLSADKQLEATEVLRHSTAAKEELTESNSLNLRLRTTYPLGRFEVEFDTDGSICKLVDENGKVWADESHRLGCFEYQTFGSDDYQHWFEHYVVQRSKTYKWADADFGKPGMEFAEPKPENLCQV
ncbi:DUF5054 domain-containing protein [Paenibacillus sp.]|uniref:DUF5054 domain-containing protein n=1 Tax=Paenibacillus sp. TaxID=58172 RepID=UPI0028A96098|nr:DUF5054 domain-containing protein [Paenibacillus sp.]